MPRVAKKTKINVYKCDGKVKKKISLPEVFMTTYRPDIIKRCFVAAMANRRQPYGASPTAGMMHAVEWPGKGRGMARTPRLDGGRGRAAQAPNTVGGRRAHPPRAEKNWRKKVNKKEAKLGRLSAIACIARAEFVKARGHKFDDKLTLPLVVENKIEEVKSVKDVVEILKKLGVYDDVLRAKNGKKIRAGRGKSRGRKYRVPKSLLVVMSSKDTLRYFRNLPGVDAVTPEGVSITHLAPGGHAGRLTLFSESAFERFVEAVK